LASKSGFTVSAVKVAKLSVIAVMQDSLNSR